MKKPTIGCAMIVKNESACLAKCLESIKGVDELVIVDTGSQDNTIEIAKKYTDKVYEDYKWNDNFAEARNHVLSKMTTDWVLSIDADEYLHDFSKVIEAVELAEKAGSLSVDCKLYAENGGQMHQFPRLFKRCKEVWWEGAVHNHLSVRPLIVHDVAITYGYSPAHQLDPDRAMRILKKEVERTGNGRETFYLGREYWYRGNFLECIKYMEQYVPKSQFLAEKADAYLLISRSYWAIGNGDKAREACMNAIIINPHFKEAVLFMAKLAGRGSGNPLWEKNATQWEKMAETADNTNVLFVR